MTESNEEKSKGFPAREEAEKLFEEAERLNVGAWGNHSRNVAICAERLLRLVIWTAKRHTF